MAGARLLVGRAAAGVVARGAAGAVSRGVISEGAGAAAARSAPTIGRMAGGLPDAYVAHRTEQTTTPQQQIQQQAPSYPSQSGYDYGSGEVGRGAYG